MRDSTSCTGTARRTGIVMPRSGARSSRAASAIAAGALAILFWALGSPAAVAQTQPGATHAGSGDELRPLYANSMDIAEGKRLAQHFCADCHGAEGVSAIPGVPNLAGQRSPYLYREMRAYLSGARGNDTMNGAITYLSADALSNVAAYYSTLTPAQPVTTGSAYTEVDPMLAGKAAAAACAGCHGENGISKTPGMPSLVGQEPKYLVGAMTAYKNGERKNDIMKGMLAPVPDANLDNIALFFALQKPARAPTPAAGNATTGQALAAPCAACHGAEGVSGNPSSPSLAGQDAQVPRPPRWRSTRTARAATRR